VSQFVEFLHFGLAERHKLLTVPRDVPVDHRLLLARLLYRSSLIDFPFAPEAKEDLLDIWTYIANENAAMIADELLREIDKASFVLGAWRAYGMARDNGREGLRSVLVSRYVVFYCATPKAIEIVRVLDERRDVQTIIPSEYWE
jgi:plasmid stabilization system protein ParE